MKKVEVTSCSHSHGWCAGRVTTSQKTEVVKPSRQMPQSAIITRSTTSKLRHLRWRFASRTMLSPLMPRRLIDRSDQLQNLHRVGTEILRDLVLQWLG